MVILVGQVRQVRQVGQFNKSGGRSHLFTFSPFHLYKALSPFHLYKALSPFPLYNPFFLYVKQRELYFAKQLVAFSNAAPFLHLN